MDIALFFLFLETLWNIYILATPLGSTHNLCIMMTVQFLLHFWATICKTVCPVLPDRCLSGHVCL